MFQYAASPLWKLPYAPHDLGEYPVAFSRSRHDGLEDASEPMPVEESGNLIILADAIAHDDGNTRFSDPWWPLMTKWVNYLERFGPDPQTQLCTDDFNGKLAHNSNLAVKGHRRPGGLRRPGQDAGRHGHLRPVHRPGRADAKHWMAAAADGDHYRLAYDKPGTWSQMYNLVWDKIAGPGRVPARGGRPKEVAHYKTVLQPYGLPLDSRNMRTKADWTVWTASLADSQGRLREP